MILLLFRNATTRLSQDLAGISPEFCHQSGVPGYLTPEKAPCYLKNYATESTGKAFQVISTTGVEPRGRPKGRATASPPCGVMDRDSTGETPSVMSTRQAAGLPYNHRSCRNWRAASTSTRAFARARSRLMVIKPQSGVSSNFAGST